MMMIGIGSTDDMLRFIFRRWSSEKTPTFPVELPPGQQTFHVECDVCCFRKWHNGKYLGCACDQFGSATRARARIARTRGNDD